MTNTTGHAMGDPHSVFIPIVAFKVPDAFNVYLARAHIYTIVNKGVQHALFTAACARKKPASRDPRKLLLLLANAK